MSQVIGDHWLSFATNGKLDGWQAYTKEKPQVLVIAGEGAKMSSVRDWKAGKLSIWEKLFETRAAAALGPEVTETMPTGVTV